MSTPKGTGRQLPPVAQLAVTSMGLVLVAGVYLAAYLPQQAPLAPAVVLVVLALLAAGAASLMLARVPDFAWARFRQVGGWALVAYFLIAGLLEYVFVADGTTGPLLALFTAALALFAISVPLLLGFSVARFQSAEPPERG